MPLTGVRGFNSFYSPEHWLYVNPELSARERYPIMLDKPPPLGTRLHIRILGSKKIGTDTVHFSRPTFVYMTKCSEHNVYYLDYLRGWPPHQRLICPKCLADSRMLQGGNVNLLEQPAFA